MGPSTPLPRPLVTYYSRDWRCPLDVRFGSKADMCSARGHVCFTPNSGHVQCNSACPLCANSGHSDIYSITSSARASSDDGTVRPRTLAACRLMHSSNLVDCITGKSAGLAPLRYAPHRCRPDGKPRPGWRRSSSSRQHGRVRRQDRRPERRSALREAPTGPAVRQTGDRC